MDQIYTPTDARKNFFNILKQVNEESAPVTVKPQQSNKKGAVIIGADDWAAIQETLFLVNNGVDRQIRDREAHNDGFTDVDDIDWDNL